MFFVRVHVSLYLCVMCHFSLKQAQDWDALAGHVNAVSAALVYVRFPGNPTSPSPLKLALQMSSVLLHFSGFLFTAHITNSILYYLISGP